MLKEIIAEQAQRYDSFYLYDESRILENIGRLKAGFPRIHFLYSVKCNPHPRVLRSIFGQGFGADAAIEKINAAETFFDVTIAYFTAIDGFTPIY